MSVYIQACAEAETIHREKCQEFCSAFKALDLRTPCVGRFANTPLSAPLARSE